MCSGILNPDHGTRHTAFTESQYLRKCRGYGVEDRSKCVKTRIHNSSSYYLASSASSPASTKWDTSDFVRSCFFSDHLRFVQNPLRTPRPAPHLMRAQSWLVERRTNVTGFLSLIQGPVFQSNDDENTHILMVAQAQAVSSLSVQNSHKSFYLLSWFLSTPLTGNTPR